MAAYCRNAEAALELAVRACGWQASANVLMDQCLLPAYQRALHGNAGTHFALAQQELRRLCDSLLRCIQEQEGECEIAGAYVADTREALEMMA